MDKPSWRPVHKIVAQSGGCVFLAGNLCLPSGSAAPLTLHESLIASASFNDKGNLLATGGDDKLVAVWDTATWTCLGKRKAEKKVTAVAIVDEDVIWSDRMGTVFKIKITDLSTEDVKPTVILGHCSWITHLLITSSGKTQYIVTSDRDEKIRVSYYPDSYDILAYCLGHTTFVSALAIFPDQGRGDGPFAVSGGGESTLFLWDLSSGKLKASCSTQPQTTNGIIRQILALDEQNIIVLVEDDPTLHFYTVSELHANATITHNKSISLSSIPFSVASIKNEIFVSTIDGVFAIADNKATLATFNAQVQASFAPEDPNTKAEVLELFSLKQLKKHNGSEENKKERKTGEPPQKKKRKRVGGKNVNAKKTEG